MSRSPNSAWVEAAEKGDVAALQGMYHRSDSHARTALHVASLHGHVGVVDAAAAAKVDPNLALSHNWESLWKGSTAMHFAALNDQRDVILKLRITQCRSLDGEHGANVDAQDAIGCTPLMVAAYEGSTRAANVLLDLGCDPNVTTKRAHLGEPKGLTAYDIARRRDNHAIASLLAPTRGQHDDDCCTCFSSNKRDSAVTHRVFPAARVVDSI